MVHGREAYETAVEASNILFSKKVSMEQWNKLDKETLLEIFEGVPQASVSRAELEKGIEIVPFLTDVTGFLPSNSEARRALKENSLAINKEKFDDDKIVGVEDIIGGSMILLQRGKKNYFLILVD